MTCGAVRRRTERLVEIMQQAGGLPGKKSVRKRGDSCVNCFRSKVRCERSISGHILDPHSAGCACNASRSRWRILVARSLIPQCRCSRPIPSTATASIYCGGTTVKA
eukprot:54524-Eustigmatos_ZCMA.PRE.1